MIRTKRIHESDYLHDIETEYNSNKKFFREKEIDLEILHRKLNQNKLFMESDSELIQNINEGASDILRSIGQKIIDIVEQVKKYIEEQVQKVKNILWEKRDKEKLLDKMKEENPELVERIKIQIENGNWNWKDFDAVSNFYKNADNTLKELEKADEKSLKGKIERAKENLEKSADVIIKVGAVAGGVMTVVKTFRELREYARNDRDSIERDIERIQECANATGNHIRSMQISSGSVKATFSSTDVLSESSDDISIIKEKESFVAYIANLYSKVTKKAIGDRISFMNKMDSAVNRAISIGNKGGEK